MVACSSSQSSSPSTTPLPHSPEGIEDVEASGSFVSSSLVVVSASDVAVLPVVVDDDVDSLVLVGLAEVSPANVVDAEALLAVVVESPPLIVVDELSDSVVEVSASEAEVGGPAGSGSKHEDELSNPPIHKVRWRIARPPDPRR